MLGQRASLHAFIDGLMALRKILGIGDQGVGGILISVAKLVIYTLCAGIVSYDTPFPRVATVRTKMRKPSTLTALYLWFWTSAPT